MPTTYDGETSERDLPQALNALASSFGSGDDLPANLQQVSLEQVHAFVSARVAKLLDENPALLMSILYRIDVAEPHVRRVLERESPDEMVDRLSSLMIQRQLEKVRTRRYYRDQAED